MTAVIALIVGFGGVGLGALLARRNEKRSSSERLLTQALNDGVAAIAEIAAGGGADAQSSLRIGVGSNCVAWATGGC
jgi:hypothetical protein